MTDRALLVPSPTIRMLGMRDLNTTATAPASCVPCRGEQSLVRAR